MKVQYMQKTKSVFRCFKENSPKLLVLLFSAIMGCITVNVNFPESAVQKAADNFVHDLYKGAAPSASSVSKEQINSIEKSSVKPAIKPDMKPAAQKHGAKNDLMRFFNSISIGIPSAMAQEINVSTPKAVEIRDRMKLRVAAIKQNEAKGLLCEDEDGFIQLKNPLQSTSELLNLIKVENKDREELYSEIQEANRITDRKQSRIKKYFYEAFRKEGAPSCH